MIYYADVEPPHKKRPKLRPTQIGGVELKLTAKDLKAMSVWRLLLPVRLALKSTSEARRNMRTSANIPSEARVKETASFSVKMAMPESDELIE